MPPRTWISDANNQSAIWVCGRAPVQRYSSGQSHFYTWAQIAGIFIFSIYAPPRLSHEEFTGLLSNIVDEARGKTPILVASDFNAWSTEWGSRETKPRGEALLDALAPLDVLLLNTGSKPTFVGQQGESIVDLTFAGVSLHDRAASWHVSDVYTGSDHQAIVFEVLLEENRIVSRPPAGNRKWSARTFDGDCFAEVVSAMNIRPGISEDMVDELMSTIVRACDASMSGGGDRRRREPVYWWNDSIEECRRSFLRLRRRAQRARGRADETICREEFADARRRLHRAIKASKRLCWRQLCDEADCDVWGKPYRVVMSRLRAPRTSPPSAPELVRRAVSTLFPMIVPRPIDAPPLLEEHLIPEVGVEELRWAYGRVRIGAAPGPDGIPNIALKAAVEACFENFHRVFTANLPWNPPPTVRCACFDTAGKILERIIAGRLETHTEGPAGLADSQYGFRKGRSTVDAIQAVLSTARTAISGKRWHRGTKEYCAIITLDVRNAFNSARWNKILIALSQMEVRAHLLRIVSSYFLDRVLEFTTDDGSETYEVTAGVPQGSVLGPILWNVMYDRILRLKLPRSAKIVGFADDIAVTVVAKHLDLVEFYSNETIRLVRAALTDLGLQTTDQKTEVLLVTSRKMRETITLRAGDHYITSAPCIRYLGVHIDARLRFVEHLRIVSDKANRVAGALLGIMPNIGGPRSSRRRLYASVVDSILLYGAPAWSEAAKTHDYVRRAASIHRRACLRVICGFCSISHEASYVLASIPPLELLIDERSRLYHRRLENVGSEERAKTIEKWQAQWARSTKGRWTHRLIPNIIPWIERRHGEANYHHLTQLLLTATVASGHTCVGLTTTLVTGARRVLWRWKMPSIVTEVLFIGYTTSSNARSNAKINLNRVFLKTRFFNGTLTKSRELMNRSLRNFYQTFFTTIAIGLAGKARERISELTPGQQPPPPARPTRDRRPNRSSTAAAQQQHNSSIAVAQQQPGSHYQHQHQEVNCRRSLECVNSRRLRRVAPHRVVRRRHLVRARACCCVSVHRRTHSHVESLRTPPVIGDFGREDCISRVLACIVAYARFGPVRRFVHVADRRRSRFHRDRRIGAVTGVVVSRLTSRPPDHAVSRCYLSLANRRHFSFISATSGIDRREPESCRVARVVRAGHQGPCAYISVHRCTRVRVELCRGARVSSIMQAQLASHNCMPSARRQQEIEKGTDLAPDRSVNDHRETWIWLG
ncbi:unnamed protein product, partial [Trichogramma brassicae]